MTILIVITLVTNLLLQSFIVLMKDADLSANIHKLKIPVKIAVQTGSSKSFAFRVKVNPFEMCCFGGKAELLL